jgi:hypothetical protein
MAVIGNSIALVEALVRFTVSLLHYEVEVAEDLWCSSSVTGHVFSPSAAVQFSDIMIASSLNLLLIVVVIVVVIVLAHFKDIITRPQHAGHTLVHRFRL